MNDPITDKRSRERRDRDDQIATEPPLTPPNLPGDTVPTAVEAHLARQQRRPLAMLGIVENGLVRPIDPAVALPEHSQVIIVTSLGT